MKARGHLPMVLCLGRRIVLAGSLLLAVPILSAAAAPLEEATGELRARLKRAGRAEVTLDRVVADPMTGRSRTTRGRLALEPPASARIEFSASGEQVVVRADGGEWIQPALEQMIRVPGSRLKGAQLWWMLFAGADPGRFVARRVGAGCFVVAPKGAPGDSARVRLGKNGLPVELAIDEGLGVPSVYRFSGWRFTAARGPRAFVLEAPPGFTVVDLP